MATDVFDISPLSQQADSSATRSHPVARLHATLHGSSPTIRWGASYARTEDVL